MKYLETNRIEYKSTLTKELDEKKIQASNQKHNLRIYFEYYKV